jgi:hypothetical protein
LRSKEVQKQKAIERQTRWLFYFNPLEQLTGERVENYTTFIKVIKDLIMIPTKRIALLISGAALLIVLWKLDAIITAIAQLSK